MKPIRKALSVFLALALLASLVPAYAAEPAPNGTPARGIQSGILLDEDPEDGYVGDYVVIYNPATAANPGRTTGNMTGLIETNVGTDAVPGSLRAPVDEARPYRIDIDQQLPQPPAQKQLEAPEALKTSFQVGDTRPFVVLEDKSPTGEASVEFKCLAVGAHCYIWTPTSTAANVYPLDSIDPSFADIAAAEFDSKFDLMQSSFGNHANGSEGDGRLHILYYNIDDGWQPGDPYIAGFFYAFDFIYNGLPILNIDTYPGVTYPNSNNEMQTRIEGTYGTMVHEYQHLINYSNTYGMSSWLNECFSAAAEEICYPGSSVIPRIQSWEHYYYSRGNDWLDPPAEHAYTPSSELHNGYSLYNWSNNLGDILALYAQVSLFSQYLYTRFGNTIYRQISDNYSSSETAAITAATGVDCSELAKDYRVAMTANCDYQQNDGLYGFKPQEGYDPAAYHGVQNPYSLLSPVVFTGSTCILSGGGAITVKPVDGIYYPPEGSDPDLKYIGITFASPYTITAVANNDAWGTVTVTGKTISANPIDGYYVESCDVIEGTSTTTIKLNEIRVTPKSDCTIRVNFAPKPNCTIQYVASGTPESQQTALLYDEITLPETVSVNPDGWSFSGWTETKLAEETTDKPVFFAPGAAYTVTGDRTLFAVYTRYEGDGALVFKLLDSAPENWEGSYVISRYTDNSMSVLKGVTPSYDGAGIQNSDNRENLVNTGITLEGDCLRNVDKLYLFHMERHGSYYSLQSAFTGSYVGVNASSDLAGYTEYVSSYCDWTPGVGENASCMKSNSNGSYPYLSYSASGWFWTSRTLNKDIRLWKATYDYITYYHTDPVIGEHDHELEHIPASDPSCTESGNIEHWRCTICNRCFSDAEGQNEIPAASVVIPALNHDWSDWGETTPPSCTAAGEESRSCSRCPETETRPVEALGHDYQDVVTDPTCTEGGYTTHTCSRCNNSYTDNETEALGHDFGAWTETVPPSCTAAGEETGSCSRCPETETRPVEALGHDYQDVVTDPTCTEGGYTTHTCSRCNNSYTDNETEALGHDFGDWTETTPPSCTAAGEETGSCSRCPETETRPVEALGHAWDEGVVTVKPTDSKDGECLYTCTRCNETKAEVLPKLDRENPFVDVLLGSYYYDQVLWAYYHEPQITKGTDDTHFSPDAGCTRAQVATFLYAAAGKPAFEMPDASFTDVKEGDWYYKAVMWALSQDITAGMGDGSFGANVTCTRAQIVTFLYAAAHKPAFEMPDASFTDVTEGDWFYKPVMWALSNKVTAGMGDGSFDANSTCTRAQIVTFLYKVYGVNE